MSRDRIRAAARLKGPRTSKSNSWQQILPVLVGGAIGMFSSVLTTMYNQNDEFHKMMLQHQEEIQNISLQQKILFEKDLVGCISANLSVIRRVIELDPRDYVKFLTGDMKTKALVARDSFYHQYIRDQNDWTFRTTGIKLLMSSYVDSLLCNEFAALDSSLINAHNRLSGNMSSSIRYAVNLSIQQFYEDRRLNENAYSQEQAKFEEFMGRFHTAIMRNQQ